MKRSDLTTRIILHVVATAGMNAWEVLSADRPAKVVLAAIQREYDAGNLECGVSETRPWLTPKGRAKLAEIDPNGRVAVAYIPTLPAPKTGLARAVEDVNEYLVAGYRSIIAAEVAAHESEWGR